MRKIDELIVSVQNRIKDLRLERTTLLVTREENDPKAYLFFIDGICTEKSNEIEYLEQLLADIKKLRESYVLPPM